MFELLNLMSVTLIEKKMMLNIVSNVQNAKWQLCYLADRLSVFKFILLFIWHLNFLYDMKDLTAQVSSENDPISFLPKVVALLFLQVCLIVLPLIIFSVLRSILLYWSWETAYYIPFNLFCRRIIKLFRRLEGQLVLLSHYWR